MKMIQTSTRVQRRLGWLALACATSLLPHGAWAQSAPANPDTPATTASAASAANRSIVGGVADSAREAGRTIGSEARKIGSAVAQGAKEAASAASTTAKEVWSGARQGAQRVGAAASAAGRELKGSPAASQPPAPVETRSTTR